MLAGVADGLLSGAQGRERGIGGQIPFRSADVQGSGDATVAAVLLEQAVEQSGQGRHVTAESRDGTPGLGEPVEGQAPRAVHLGQDTFGSDPSTSRASVTSR